MSVSRRVHIGSAVAAVSLLLGLVAPTGVAAAAPSFDRTSAKERHRVDSVPTPHLVWGDCFEQFQCSTTELPLDYDHPNGRQTEIALLKYPARIQAGKIGTLFVNPGGPGISGTEVAAEAQNIFGADILDHFDIVGFDPRGVGASENVQCFSSAAEQAPVLDTIYNISFPDDAQTAAAYIKASKALGRACSTTGKPLSVSMSTAQVARDLDVLRRAVGDRKLSYLGWSYGSYLGQVYANLFPDRVRALVLDGVVDPLAWRGSERNHNDPMWDRMHSAEGSARALRTILLRCDRVGTDRCAYAAGSPVSNFDMIARRLKANPLQFDDGAGGTFSYGYDDFIGEILDYLYRSDGADLVIATLVSLRDLTSPAAQRTTADRAASRRARTSLATIRSTVAEAVPSTSRAADDPYDNAADTFASISCTDSKNPDKIAKFPAYAAQADRRVKYFGALWVWNTPFCARNAFTAHDEDAYRGSFSHRTRSPILFVGNNYDPATNVHAAKKAAALAPNSALILSNSWGHTAYGTSACVTDTVDNYLLTGKPAAKLTRCVGDYQPFASPSPSMTGASRIQQRLAANRS